MERVSRRERAGRICQSFVPQCPPSGSPAFESIMALVLARGLAWANCDLCGQRIESAMWTCENGTNTILHAYSYDVCDPCFAHHGYGVPLPPAVAPEEADAATLDDEESSHLNIPGGESDSAGEEESDGEDSIPGQGSLPRREQRRHGSIPQEPDAAIRDEAGPARHLGGEDSGRSSSRPRSSSSSSLRRPGSPPSPPRGPPPATTTRVAVDDGAEGSLLPVVDEAAHSRVLVVGGGGRVPAENNSRSLSSGAASAPASERGAPASSERGGRGLGRFTGFARCLRGLCAFTY